MSAGRRLPSVLPRPHSFPRPEWNTNTVLALAVPGLMMCGRIIPDQRADWTIIPHGGLCDGMIRWSGYAMIIGSVGLIVLLRMGLRRRRSRARRTRCHHGDHDDARVDD